MCGSGYALPAIREPVFGAEPPILFGTETAGQSRRLTSGGKAELGTAHTLEAKQWQCLHAADLLEALLIFEREEQLIAVGIVDLDHVITPPRFLAGNRALDELSAKLRYALRGQ